MKSSTKVSLFLIFCSLAVIVGAELLWQREGLVWATLLVLCLNAWLYFFSDRYLLRRLHCKPLVGQDPWGLVDKVAPLAKKMGVTTPKLYFFPETVPSAFSIGCRRHHSSLVFSEGLLNHLSDNELRAVIAHELAKIQRGETKALILTSALARAILFFPQILDKIITLGKSQDQASSQSWQPLTQIFAPFAGFIVRLSINRNVYYESDRRAAELLGDSRELAKVLWKMESYAQTKPILLPATSSHLFTVNPLTSLGWNRYFHCQPPIDQRIRGLVGHFPI